MSKMFFHKTGHDLLLMNAVFIRLPHDVKGIFFELRMFAGSSELQDGSFELGSSKRATINDLILLFGDGTKSKRNYYEKCIKRLCDAGVMHVGRGGVLFCSTYMEEQGLGATFDANRKRDVAADGLRQKAERVRGPLIVLFRRAEALPREIVISRLKAVVGGNKRTLEPLFDLLESDGFLRVGEGGLWSLASLAPPPVAGSGSGVAGSNYSGPRNIPLEPELETELKPEREVSYETPSGTDSGARGRPFRNGHGSPLAGSDFEEGGGASEARSFRGSGVDRGSSGVDGCNIIYSPEDAWTAPDPVDATVDLLSRCVGWQEQRSKAYPSSRTALVSRWKKLRDELGPDVAVDIWRHCLFDAAEDVADNRQWKSYVAIFLSRVEKATVIAVECAASLASVEE